jgi:hypothetical protein
MSKTQKTKLDTDKIMREFQQVENSEAHRRGTFKVEAPFEKAVDTILKSANQKSRPKARKN